MIFNARLDAAVTALFMTLVAIVVLDAARVWWRTLSRTAAGARRGGRRSMTALRHALANLRAFLRGFVGATQLGPDPRARAVRARRQRGRCC